MSSRRLGVVLALAVTSIGIFAGQTWIVRFDGVGPVRVGMSLTQLNVILHENFSPPRDKDEQACFYVNPARHRGISFMIEDGRVTRVDVDSGGTPTADGIRIGDSEERVERVYGWKLKVTPHAYTAPEGHYLTIRSKDGRYAIRFETDKGRVVRFYAGRLAAVSYIEGCL